MPTTSSPPETQELLERLSRRFPAQAVDKNPKGFHYISIDATIKRLNEVLGTEWALNYESGSIQLLDPADVTYGRNAKPGYLAHVVASIQALGTNRFGVGSDFADDADKSFKTAQAEALKKAGHQYGIGLYLWDERERRLVDLVREGNFKMAVQTLAAIEGVPANAEDIAAHFNTPVEELQHANVLDDILTEAGLL